MNNCWLCFSFHFYLTHLSIDRLVLSLLLLYFHLNLIISTFYEKLSTVFALSATSTSIVEFFECVARCSFQNKAGGITVNTNARYFFIFKVDQINTRQIACPKAVTHLPIWQKMLFPPTSLLHSVFASHTYFCIHFSDALPVVLTKPFSIVIDAIPKSLTLSFLPIDRAASDRCEKDVFNASNKLTTILMNSPACLAIMFTWSGSLAPKTPWRTAAKMLYFFEERNSFFNLIQII